MICPKCGNEIDLFADKCLCCGMSFKSIPLAERQKFQRKPVRNTRRVPRKKSKSTNVKATQTRIEYNNGIACKEGMSYTGKKLKKGSFKKRPNNEGIGYRLRSYGTGEYPYQNGW